MSRVKKERLKRGNLFIPLIFSFGAKLEDLPIEVFLHDPTKISNTLRMIRDYFQVDGLVSYGDDTALAEALGVFPNGSGPSHYGEGLSEAALKALEAKVSGLLQLGRIPIAIEVTKRLNVLLPDTIIMGFTPGPLKLACQLSGLAVGEAINQKSLMGCTSKATLDFSKALGDAGIDVLVVLENRFPPLDGQTEKDLARYYTPLWNTAKFYGHSAFLLLEQFSIENVDPLRRIVDGLILPAERAADIRQKFKKVSFSLPVSLLEKEEQEIESFLSQSGILSASEASQMFLLTTAGEIPGDIHKEYMIRGIHKIRDLVSA
jgi:hypothetical protein